MAANERIVNLAVRARDEYSKVFKNLEGEAKRLAIAMRASERRKQTSAAKQAIQSEIDGYKRLHTEIKRYQAVLSNARSGKINLGASEIQEVREQISLLRARANDSVGALNNQRVAFDKLTGSTKSGFGAMDRFAVAMRVTSGETVDVNQATSALVPTLNRKDTATKKATTTERAHAAAMEASAASARRMNAAQSGARLRNNGKRGDAQEVEFLGLKPWQLTNLGYQVNDVVSGLAMGQKPLQVFSQQVGQFIQIWPQMMVGLARSIPVIAGVTAVLSPLIIAISRAAAQRAALRAFTAELALNADGARYTAQGLTDVAVAMTRVGIAMDKARGLVNAFMRQGLNADQMMPIVTLARQLAVLTGESIPDAAERLARAFTGNANSIRELDRELNFLTASQLEQIRAMERAGDRAGAMALAQAALGQRLAETVQPLTNFQEAIKDLGENWNTMIESIQGSAFLEWLKNDLAKGIEGLTRDIENFNRAVAAIENFVAEPTMNETESELANRITEIQDEIERAMGDSRNMRFGDPAESREVIELQRMLAQVKQEYEDIKQTIANAAEEQAALTEAAEAAAEAGSDATEATEEELKNRADINAAIQDQLAGLRDSLDTVGQTSREQAIQNALLDARNAALAVANQLGVDFLGLTEDQTRAIRDQAGALYDAQQSSNLLGSMGSFVDRVVGVESGGNANAQNPNSTATGLGQFIESTWIEMFQRYFPDRASTMTQGAILALRRDSDLSRQMIELYARENADVLQRAGVAVNEASLYLAHFLGPRGAAGVMAANASTPVSDILQPAQINANRSILEGRNAGEVRDWAANKMSISPAEMEANSRLLEIDRERAEEVETYNEGYQERIAALQFEISQQQEAAREATIAAAIREEEIAAERAGVELTRERREEIARLTGALYDRQNAEAEVNALMEERSIIQERLQLAQSAGNQEAVAALTAELSSVDDTLESAIERAIAFWEAMGGAGAEQAIARLQLLRDQLGQITEDVGTKFLPTAEQLNERIADGVSNALSSIARQAAAGELTFKSFFQTLMQGLGEFLIEIGKAIVKQAIFNAISGATGGGATGGGATGGGATGGGGGGLVETIAGWIGKIFHEGGVVGGSAPGRMVNPAVFSGATRYHTGGMAGLKPNEVPIIAERGEEILAADDPRHRNNASQTNVKVINVLDPAEVLEKALGTEVGEKAFINFMARRSRQINGVLG